MDDPRPTDDALRAWLETQREIAMLMGHDLRNPVAAILANLNFLELACPEDPDILGAIQDIKLSAEVLLRIVDNSVTVARLEAGDGPGDGVVVVAAAARAAFERATPLLSAAGVQAELAIEDDRAAVRGEAALVESLVENLVGNAAQHVRRGGRAKLTVAAEGGDRVAIRLEDDGPPYGAARVDFTRDGQIELKKRTTGRYSRGLALYVVGLAARALGGAVDVGAGRGDGSPGARACATVALPRAAADAP